MARRKKSKRYWDCDECGQRNHFSTDNCLGEKCLADYWKRQAERHYDIAQKCLEKAQFSQGDE
jgi:hypothetical protein